jgi:hypothetical protein
MTCAMSVAFGRVLHRVPLRSVLPHTRHVRMHRPATIPAISHNPNQIRGQQMISQVELHAHNTLATRFAQ